LRSDNLIIKTQQSLTFRNITIIGLDMSVSNILAAHGQNCSVLPNPSACSCQTQFPYTYNEPSLYNSKSLCYINQPTVSANLNAFLGFIQLSWKIRNNSAFIFNW
jgi:hypothetical protein